MAELDRLVNKEFEKMLSALEIGKILSTYGLRSKRSFLGISGYKSKNAKKALELICVIVVDRIDNYIGEYGGIIKAEVSHSVAHSLNRQVSQDIYAPHEIRDSIIQSDYFQKALENSGIKKKKVREIAEVVETTGPGDESRVKKLGLRSMFYKEKEGAKRYLESRVHSLGYRLK